jgi:predicted DNA-binding protein (MmcQ/YjbR family)
MNVERAREYMLGLEHVEETMQWGGIVFWVGDKAIGGKMFAMLPLDDERGRVISYAAGPERFAELVEMEGIIPAPYLARAFWVAVEGWGTHREAQWERELEAARGVVFDRLPPRTKALLGLPAAERKRAVAARKKLLTEREAATEAGRGAKKKTRSRMAITKTKG